MQENVLITGGTGLIGSQLVSLLKSKHYNVAVLSRQNESHLDVPVFYWDPLNGEIDKRAVKYSENIIHLAGENLAAKRWTNKRKNDIINSRAKTAEFLSDWVLANKKTRSFISASAVGYYGMQTSEKVFVEDDPPASDFLGETCEFWEASADRFALSGIRTVILRLGAVLSKNSLMLSKLSDPYKMGITAILGTGKQFIPWIHIKDVINIFYIILKKQETQGTYNVVAPEYVDNKQFTQLLSKITGNRILPFAVPSTFIKTVYGEIAGMALEGSRISPKKIIDAGYKFKFPKLQPALEDIYN